MTASKEPNMKHAEETKSPDGHFNLDGILTELGSFGKYQLLMLLLLSFRDSFLAMCNWHFMFSAMEVPFRCYVPECESSENIHFNEPWTSFTQKEGICYRAAPLNDSVNNSYLDQRWRNNTREACTSDIFDMNKNVPCERVIYENYNSLVAEFDLGCDPMKQTLISTIHSLGLVFSYVILGFVSDRYGRKVIIVGSPIIVGVMGLLKSVTGAYWQLLLLEFIESAFGYGNASLILALEAVNQKQRVVFSCANEILSSFGSAFIGLIAWKFPYWRHFMRAIYAPLLIGVFYIFFMDEGVRWLLVHNRKSEAVRILNKVAKINNVTLSTTAKEMLKSISEEKTVTDENSKEAPQPISSNVFSDLKSKTMLWRVVLCAICFFCSLFVQQGAVLNTNNLWGNKYINFSAMILVGIPTRLVTAYTLSRFRRKTPMFVSFFLCAVFFISSAFLPETIGWSSVLLYMAGRMCNSYGLFSIYLVTMEMFPTTSRTSMLSIASTAGRFGMLASSYSPMLKTYMKGLPCLAFGVAAIGAALISLLLPDTSKVVLPDKVQDAENLDNVADDDA